MVPPKSTTEMFHEEYPTKLDQKQVGFVDSSETKFRRILIIFGQIYGPT